MSSLVSGTSPKRQNKGVSEEGREVGIQVFRQEEAKYTHVLACESIHLHVPN